MHELVNERMVDDRLNSSISVRLETSVAGTDTITSFVAFISDTCMSAIRSSPKDNKALKRPSVVEFCCGESGMGMEVSWGGGWGWGKIG